MARESSESRTYIAFGMAFICVLGIIVGNIAIDEREARIAVIFVLSSVGVLSLFVAMTGRATLANIIAQSASPQTFRAYLSTRGIDVITRDMPHTHVTLAMVRDCLELAITSRFRFAND